MFDKLAGAGLSMLTEMVLDKGEKVVKDFVSDKIGIDITDDTAISSNMDALKDLDMQLMLDKEYNRHDEKVLDLALHDVQDAREQGKTMMESDNTPTKLFLPFFTLVITASIIASFVFANLDEGVREVLKTILIMIISYWFGSSQGSKQKTDALIGA
jgi:hypothetical protein